MAGLNIPSGMRCIVTSVESETSGTYDQFSWAGDNNGHILFQSKLAAICATAFFSHLPPFIRGPPSQGVRPPRSVIIVIVGYSEINNSAFLTFD
ncbi:hypothetical protein Zmor_002053 [Zophobas morio]|uniref:Uncharacterized protein n=1 Tax=Zophobas morio TaxID=2755281 RepID=A0AA38J3X0_9CUCU|nr:hypothetical protein Zmor_002053 [Zophobas morio]